ncbi:MAG: hypothetical protein RLZZ223_659 [Candidatus Parcubacteria bacterium]|jgi:cytoskeletal protein CcmA (bactofilin family)
MNKQLILSLIIPFLIITPSASALMLDAGDTVSPQQKVEGDAYLAAENINIQNPIEGDAIIAGGLINIDSNITQDAIIVGDKVNINQEIGDDIRAAASTVAINANVKGDLIVFAEKLIINQSSTISGDIIAFVSQLQLDGTVNGNIKIASTSTSIKGTVLGDTKIQTANFNLEGRLEGKTEFTATKNTRILEAARFGGSLNYGTPKELSLAPNLEQGVIAKYDPELIQNQNIVKRLFSVNLVFRLFSAALVIGLLFIFVRKFVFKATQKLNTKADAFRALGYGAILYLAPIPISILFIITIVGIPIGILIAVSYLSLLFFSQSIASFVAAQWLHQKHQFGKDQYQVYLIALGIYIVLYLLDSVPILGGLIKLIILYITLGTLILEIRNNK